MNKTILIGRLTADPELKSTQNGKSFCRFKIAVDRVGEGADFIPCTSWGKTAENMSKYLKKGAKIAVGGRIQSGSYEKDGQKVYTLDVVANDVEFLESKRAETQEQEYVPVADEISDDDLPF